MPGTTNGRERHHEVWRKLEVVKQSVLSQNNTKYAQLMMKTAPIVLLPTASEFDGSDSPLDSFHHQLDGQDDSMLEIIEGQLEYVQRNLVKAEDEPLSLVVNLIGEEPWDELWPNSKNHFYKMDMK
jgi:hypothetical protein